MIYVLAALFNSSFGISCECPNFSQNSDTCDFRCNIRNCNESFSEPNNFEDSNDANEPLGALGCAAIIVGVSSFLMCICCIVCKIVSRNANIHHSRENGDNLGQNRDYRNPITVDMINKLYPIETYKDGISIKGEPTCTICLVDFIEGENVRITKCLHTFHVECFDEWLCSMHAPKCPNCNKIVIENENHII